MLLARITCSAVFEIDFLRRARVIPLAEGVLEESRGTLLGVRVLPGDARRRQLKVRLLIEHPPARKGWPKNITSVLNLLQLGSLWRVCRCVFFVREIEV